MAINYTNSKKQAYIAYFDLLGEMLPCSFCRKYYDLCKQRIPLRDFLETSDNAYPVVYWLYLIKDLVNEKLIYQEQHCYFAECAKIDSDNTLSARQKQEKKKNLATQLFYTKPSPPYEKVLAYYMSLLSACETNETNQTLQSCRHVLK